MGTPDYFQRQGDIKQLPALGRLLEALAGDALKGGILSCRNKDVICFLLNKKSS